jgi:outer membrane lipoprotein-sorting protein
MDNELQKLLKDNPLKIPSKDFTTQTMQKIHELHEGHSIKRKISCWFILSPLAAAAALALFLIFFWPSGKQGTISWADVQKQLEQVHTMAFRGFIEISTTTGKQIIQRWKVYHKDPGLLRSEEYAPDADLDTIKPGPKSILIMKRVPGLTELLALHPRSDDHEDLLTRLFRTSGSGTSSEVIGLASENWKMMKQITEDKTMRIGDRVINGMPIVGFGFEAPAREIVDSSDAAGQASVQIWVRPDDGMPLLGELEYQNVQGQNVRIEFSDIQWNVPLEESLFGLVVPADWNLSWTRIKLAEYANTGFSPGVTLQMSPYGQEPLADTRDVVKVVWADQTSSPDLDLPSVQITIELEPGAAHRLHDYVDAHPDKIIVVNFNGQINVAAKLSAANPTQLTFDLTLLRLSLAELEARYLTTTIERNKP